MNDYVKKELEKLNKVNDNIKYSLLIHYVITQDIEILNLLKRL